MFKSICRNVAAIAVGFCTGLILGPFAGAGKIISIIKEEIIKPEEDDDDSHNKSPLAMLVGFGIGTPLFFTAGLIYGPIRGAILAAKEGLNKDMVGNIAKEMFTYDPSVLSEADAKQVPNGEGRLLSYRTFRAAGLSNSEKLNAEKTMLLPVSAASPSDGSRKKSFIFFTSKRNNTQEETKNISRRFSF